MQSKLTHYHWLMQILSDIPNGNDCLVWPYGRFKSGYGQVKIPGARGGVYVHRISFESAYGAIPKGLFVCHKCDIRECFRPTHLFLGTCADNNADMMAKGRYARGSDNGQSVLTESDVRKIRSMYSPRKMGCRRLASIFKTDRANIWYIVNRKTWTHID